MSRYIYANKIVITTGVATSLDHDGKPYLNTDFPSGTVLCFDDDECYVYSPSWRVVQNKAEEWETNSGSWPLVNRKTNKIQLFRDYWKVVDMNDSPYANAIKNAPIRVLRTNDKLRTHKVVKLK